MQRCLSGLRSTIGNRVMRERIRRFKSSSLRQQQKHPKMGCFFVVFAEYRRGFEGRAARQKSINDAFQGRDKQTHTSRVCGDRTQGIPRLAWEEPFCESKTLCRQLSLFFVLLAAKDAIDNGGAGRAAKGGNPLLCANEKTPFHRVFFLCFLPIFTCAYPRLRTKC